MKLKRRQLGLERKQKLGPGKKQKGLEPKRKQKHRHKHKPKSRMHIIGDSSRDIMK